MTKKADTGGQAVISKGEIVIRVPIAALQHIVDGSAAVNNYEAGFKVTNKQTFAREIVRAINDEDETGSTRFHRMFDDAMEHAIDQGAEGIEDRVEEQEKERVG